jgi:hypothetical protein
MEISLQHKRRSTPFYPFAYKLLSMLSTPVGPVKSRNIQCQIAHKNKELSNLSKMHKLLSLQSANLQSWDWADSAALSLLYPLPKAFERENLVQVQYNQYNM